MPPALPPSRLLTLSSLGLNLLLASWVAFSLLSKPGTVQSPPPQKPVVAVAAPPPSARLDWRALEASDFATYIANLREAKCPEHTIRTIVQAELHEVYASKKASHSQDAHALAQEEHQTLEALLSVPESSTPAHAPDVSASLPPPRTQQTSALTPVVPTAFAVGNADSAPALADGTLSTKPTDQRLTPEAARVLENLRTRFGNAVQSANQPPSGPIYLNQWNRATHDNNVIFSTLYGGDYFLRTQIEAAQKAAAAAAANKVDSAN